MPEDLTNPTHYKLANGMEVIDVQKTFLNDDEFRGYLLGCAIKYGFRFGKKKHITAEMAALFLLLLPKGNEAILKDDIVRKFTEWCNEVNKTIYAIDEKKRQWYEGRLNNPVLVDWIKAVIAKFKI
jgi:hypothetical protein